MSELLIDVVNAFSGSSDERDTPALSVGSRDLIATVLSFYATRVEPDDLAVIAWVCALLLVELDAGSTCLDFASMQEIPGASKLPAPTRTWSSEDWNSFAQRIGFGDGGRDVQPLAVAHGRLYFDRYLRLERDVARHLVQPVGPDAWVQPENWGDVVTHLFGDDPGDQQRAFASDLFDHRVNVLSGGPGTGKTFTIAKTLLALFTATSRPPSIALVAPTGKAAQRLREALTQQLREHNEQLAELVLAHVHPTTVHSLLGISPIAPRRFQRDALAIDFLICDETSMVDVSLLAELLRALSPSTRVVLVGDPNQLQSVDVGSALSDIVGARDVIAVHELETVRRVSDEMNDIDRVLLLDFYSHVRNGRSDDALTALSKSAGPLTFIAVDDEGEGVTPEITDLVLQRADALVALANAGASAPERTEALDGVMVLAAQHHGRLSRTWWVENVQRHLGFDLLNYPNRAGLPVLITASDVHNGLTNGDVGLVVAGEDGLEYRASHVDDGAAVRHLPPTAIHRWQPWWAMTIHKSQGSEFDTVLVSLTPNTRLISRELFYTAVTRAKRRVVVIGRPQDIRRAIESPARRSTGLTDAVRTTAAQLSN